MPKIKLDAKTVQALKEQRQAFVAKFGREPGPEDPIFFDPEADEPRPLSRYQIDAMHEEICAAMETVGLDPALIYASRKTGRIVTARNKRYLSKADLAEWNEAVEQFRSLGGPVQ